MTISNFQSTARKLKNTNSDKDENIRLNKNGIMVMILL